MKTTVDNLSETRVKLTVEVPFEELTDSINAAYKRISSQVSIPGFRKGKVPQRVIDSKIGRGAVLEEVVNEALPKAYEEAVAAEQIVTVSRPEVEVTELADGDKLVFTADVEIRPAFELPAYEGLEVTVDVAEITDADIEEELTSLRKRFATAVPVERPAADEDLVLIDVEGTLDGEHVEEFSATALSYEVGSAGMISGADEALRGLQEGETTSFAFTPDEGTHAGRELLITVDVKGVRERSLPDADDEFAQLASEFDTLEELRESLREQVRRNKLVEQGMAAREALLDTLLAAVEIAVPEALLASQLDEHFDDEHGDDEHRGEVQANTERAIRTQFLLDRIAEEQDFQVGQAELSQWLVSQAGRYGMSPDQFADALVQAGQVQMAVADVRRGKSLAFVLQKAVITDSAGETVNLSELDEKSEQQKQMEMIQQAIADAQAAAEAGDEEAMAEAAEALSTVASTPTAGEDDEETTKADDATEAKE